MSVADRSNDELFFNESWYAGLPVSLKGRGIEYSTEEGLVKRKVRMDRDRQRQSAGHALGARQTRHSDSKIQVQHLAARGSNHMRD